MEKILPARADLVTTCSRYLADLARQRGSANVSTLYNCIWENGEAPDRAALRREFGLRPDACYLGFIGWTATEISWCLETLRHLDPRVRLALAGCDVRSILAEFPDVAERIDALGTLSAGNAKRLMQALDIGLLPLSKNPFNESRFPMKFLDYLSAGLTVVGGDIGEVGLLGRELAGVVLAPPERQPWIDGCVRAVNAFLQDRDRRRPDPAQLHARFTWEACAADLERSYRQTLQSVGGAASAADRKQ